MQSQNLGSLLSHLPNAKTIDQSAEIVGAGICYRTDQIFSRLLSHPVQLSDLRSLEAIQIRRSMHQIVFYQLLHHCGAKPLNIHRIPTGKMRKISQKLGRALCAGTP